MRIGSRLPGLAALVLLASLAAPGLARATAEPLLVDAVTLHAQRGAADLRLVDMATERAGYRRGHLPGAVHLAFERTRVAVGEGVYRVPTPEEGARLLGTLGITPATRVVVYDDVGGLHAAWLFFVLETLGHRRVALLDGGAAAWSRAGFPLVTDVPAPAPTTYRPEPRPERVATAAWIRERLDDPAVARVDARSAAEFTGATPGARRGGHIPGAVHVEWLRHLRPDGTFKPLPELRALYAAAGITPDKTVVTYCQTHHRAAHSYFVLRLLGYPRVVGYDRSWAEWGNRDDLPVAR